MDIPGIKKLATGEAETGIYCMRKKKSTFNKKENN